MTDIVSRLRDAAWYGPISPLLCLDAADEIARLRQPPAISYRDELRNVLTLVDYVLEYDTGVRVGNLMEAVLPLIEREFGGASGWGSELAARGYRTASTWRSGPKVQQALQQSSSGITAGAEKPSQVVDSGAAGPTRTGDLLITNQGAETAETLGNQQDTPSAAPADGAQAAQGESSTCEGVTAALDDIRVALQDASRLVVGADETHPKMCRLTRDSLLKAHDAWHVISTQWADRDRNAPWLTLAHTLCTDAGVPQGHIADRLDGLRAALAKAMANER